MVLLQSSVDWQSLSVEVVDQLAWTAICHWQDHSSIDPIRNGLNYAELTRSFLWDKASRAIRQHRNPEKFAFERSLIQPLQGKFRQNRNPIAELLKQPFRPTYDRIRAIRQTSVSNRQNLPILFVPRPCPRLKQGLETLMRSKQILLRGSYLQSSYFLEINKLGQQPPLTSDEAAFAFQLYEGITEGLKAFNIELISEDAPRLQTQIIQQLAYVRVAEIEMRMTRPDAILLYADNHHPVQEYALIAQRDGIPSVMLQHGLDCERYYLDEAYASDLAVWGTHRRDRYQQDSSYQPRIVITGNPEYDRLRYPEKLAPEGNYWLWVTRPHSPEKCYAPSRYADEGIEILEALMIALSKFPDARLVIKPHPADYVERYQTYIEQHSLSDRVEVSTTNVQTLIAKASVVISEDSTAGLEAMFFGKPVIHAHFAASAPVLSFVRSSAAFPGYSPEMLCDSLNQVQQLTAMQQSDLFEAQRDFLQSHAGDCDGQAAQRVMSLILETIHKA
ncbi:capsular polysaccharide export protein, LipB/KpsS family [Leptolyngbya sp. NIES-2104]|uniref:capsular polysaccharide export protein, LipB/KpsS family n=1 Tax=Leptolyngbya sp. NIES-2104 TaxID=1552121 RepID=UPI0006EC86D6|nr:hypothetical protein [Leptolyngbya sp. NIES-2104]GAP97601.1 hypothetical protein NIES2104_41480 [Leptolyngbya sp. NIES-2104]